MSGSSEFVLDTPHGARLHGVVNLADREGARPAVVICHGFKGFFEWGFFPYLADLLASRGFTVVRFNLSGAGMKPGDELVTDLEAFRSATFSRDAAELKAVLESLGERIAPGHIDRDRIGLVGHSRGGGISLLVSAEPQWRGRIAALVTWAGVGTFDRMTDEQKEIWRERGELWIQNARTGQDLPLGRVVLEDLEQHRDELDLKEAAARREAPWLIVHGADDATVPVREARALTDVARGVVRLEIVGGGDHTFGGKHPFVGPTPHLVKALNLTQDWLRRYLSPGP
jgi:pimeloyl-ACP methyl ester carboxylesterase